MDVSGELQASADFIPAKYPMIFHSIRGWVCLRI